MHCFLIRLLQLNNAVQCGRHTVFFHSTNTIMVGIYECTEILFKKFSMKKTEKLLLTLSVNYKIRSINQSTKNHLIKRKHLQK